MGLIVVLFGAVLLFKVLESISETWCAEKRRGNRKAYYRDYLNSEDWQRKRWLVLKRDRHRCTYCGARATQVHHKKYPPRNIGREPIDWLVSTCAFCHAKQHGR